MKNAPRSSHELVAIVLSMMALLVAMLLITHLLLR
jgi:hypothetical protein